MMEEIMLEETKELSAQVRYEQGSGHQCVNLFPAAPFPLHPSVTLNKQLQDWIFF